MNGEKRRSAYRILVGRAERKTVGGWIILRWILERWDGVVWTGLV
jgi:hypothetical protein